MLTFTSILGNWDIDDAIVSKKIFPNWRQVKNHRRIGVSRILAVLGFSSFFWILFGFIDALATIWNVSSSSFPFPINHFFIDVKIRDMITKLNNLIYLLPIFGGCIGFYWFGYARERNEENIKSNRPAS